MLVAVVVLGRVYSSVFGSDDWVSAGEGRMTAFAGWFGKIGVWLGVGL